MVEAGGKGTPGGLARLATGVAGLDLVLRGGLPVGGSYLVAGTPGTGKTTLGNQVAYRHAAAGRRAIFASVLAETHDRMLAHLRGFAFFDPALAGDAVTYLNLLPTLQQEGLDGLLAAVRRAAVEQQATLLVLDGAAAVEDLAPSDHAFREFTLRLQAQGALLGCTTLLLTNRRAGGIDDVATNVDGALVLERETVGRRLVRLLEVAKLRGVDHLTGRHEFAITGDGIAVFPRPEAALAPPADAGPAPDGARLAFGVPGLDAMLGGGLLPGSAAVLTGTPGAGKTLTALHFVAEGTRRGEPGLVAGFQEPPGQLRAAAAGVGLGLDGPIDAGLVRFLWRQPAEFSPDRWAWDLLAAVRERRPRRLVVDALTDLRCRILPQDRLPDFMAALSAQLRAEGVTTVHVAELSELVGQELVLPLADVAPVIDAVVLLRHVELGSRLQRLVSVVKHRRSAFDPTIREFAVGADGVAVGGAFAGASALLTGAPVPGRPAGGVAP